MNLFSTDQTVIESIKFSRPESPQLRISGCWLVPETGLQITRSNDFGELTPLNE